MDNLNFAQLMILRAKLLNAARRDKKAVAFVEKAIKIAAARLVTTPIGLE